jgi:hypothetical protein
MGTGIEGGGIKTFEHVRFKRDLRFSKWWW